MNLALEKILPYVEKPARYIGNEINIVIKPGEPELRFALAFPDVYEIGTSYLGFSILYNLLNSLPKVQAERVFAPWPDMEAQMRQADLALYGLETKTPLARFDIVGFTLQYELGYTNILNMLDLSGIPLHSREREGLPLIIAGGPCAFNPEPLADFIDAFVLGEGEEVVQELVQVVLAGKRAGWSREELLEKLAGLEGVYVPAFYAPQYAESGEYIGTFPIKAGVPPRISKRILKNFSDFPLPDSLVVPLVQSVHDRVSIEICRGCARGCRFCQAGIIYRPVRERPGKALFEQGGKLVRSTGSAQLSLSSLSSADHSEIESMINSFIQGDISVSLPSLRVDSASVALAMLTKSARKSGLTLAPEAGSQRLRDCINKNVTDEEIFTAARTAFENGWDTLKLYFMLGLPTETREDVIGIANLVHALEEIYRQIRGNTRRFRVNLGVSTFVPKAHTPFQWAALLNREEVEARQRLLHSRLRSNRYKVQTTDWEESELEALLARGDRQAGRAILLAWQKGCRFDAWTEHFRPDLWRQAFQEAGIDTQAFAGKSLPVEATLPWDHIDSGVSRDFLLREYRNALAGSLTPDCTFAACSTCGICPAYDIKPLKRRSN